MTVQKKQYIYTCTMVCVPLCPELRVQKGRLYIYIPGIYIIQPVLIFRYVLACFIFRTYHTYVAGIHRQLYYMRWCATPELEAIPETVAQSEGRWISGFIAGRVEKMRLLVPVSDIRWRCRIIEHRVARKKIKTVLCWVLLINVGGSPSNRLHAPSFSHPLSSGEACSHSSASDDVLVEHALVSAPPSLRVHRVLCRSPEVGYDWGP